jgi:hypothetical protein
LRRIVKKVKEEGATGIIHKLRGQSSGRKLSDETKQKVLKLYRDKYEDFRPTFATEKLEEINKIKLSDETLRKWLLETGLWKKKRKSREHRKWRERKECFGQMIQLDGSHHDWLESRGEELVLMSYIDDALLQIL